MKFSKLVLGLAIPIISFSQNLFFFQIQAYAIGNVSVSPVFGVYQKQVDENIYNSMDKTLDNIMQDVYGEYNTAIYKMACDTINPCMAFATTWGEAGSSYAGISMTTVMDFNPDTYVNEIDWINVSANLNQVDEDWYIVNAKTNYNTNTTGNAYHMPNALLQYPTEGSRETSAMTGLGVGPYQITSSDWDKWEIGERVAPVEGFRTSLEKTGTSWITCGIDPYSDLTIYALLSLSHQGGGLIDYDFGKQLINIINTPSVTKAFNDVGKQMYLDFKDKAVSGSVDLSDTDLGHYFNLLEEQTGIDFSKYTGGVGRTNKGNYVALHCLRYIFYKNYFTDNV